MIQTASDERSLHIDIPADELLVATMRSARRGWLFFTLAMLLLIAILLNVGIGAVRISPDRVLAILASHAGFDFSIPFTRQQDAVLWSIRLPRVALTGLVGAGLAVSGAALQGIFRNPLADPGLIGVSSGAALGAACSIVRGFTLFGDWTLPIVAFCSGLLTTIIVYLMARHGGRTDTVTLILTGIAINAVAGAGTSFLIFLANDAELRTITFWTMGSTGGATWSVVGTYLPFAVIGLLLIPRFGTALNLLVLGEYEARHLGLNTERTRVILILLTAMLAGASVALAGLISFIGLIVPHLIRLFVGPDHRVLLPASALGGATLLLFADLFARNVVSPSELPIGIVTTLIGGPFFLWMLHRTVRRTGGMG